MGRTPAAPQTGETRMHPTRQPFQHPPVTRRTAVQAGAVGLLGLGAGAVSALRASAGETAKARAVIYVFLSGGLSQLDSFDPKPDAPAEIRGEFRPIATRT